MKSEHRHELKTNDLAKSLLTFQDYVKEYGGRVALGIVIVILIIILIIQRKNNARLAETAVANNLAYVRSQIDRLTHVSANFIGEVSVTPAQVTDVPKVIADIKDKTSDKKILAEVRVAEGDYAWGLANYPVTAAAATQPSLRPPKERADLLKDAKAAYQDVLSQFADQTLSVVSARMGLAAIAEDAKNWEEARQQYEAVTKLNGVNEMFKSLAEGKLKQLELIKNPILVGTVLDKPPVVLPETPATTTTSTTTATTAATKTATAPATKSATPTTKPSTPTTRPATTKAGK